MSDRPLQRRGLLPSPAAFRGTGAANSAPPGWGPPTTSGFVPIEADLIEELHEQQRILSLYIGGYVTLSSVHAACLSGLRTCVAEGNTVRGLDKVREALWEAQRELAECPDELSAVAPLRKGVNDVLASIKPGVGALKTTDGAADLGPLQNDATSALSDLVSETLNAAGSCKRETDKALEGLGRCVEAIFSRRTSGGPVAQAQQAAQTRPGQYVTDAAQGRLQPTARTPLRRPASISADNMPPTRDHSPGPF